MEDLLTAMRGIRKEKIGARNLKPKALERIY